MRVKSTPTASQQNMKNILAQNSSHLLSVSLTSVSNLYVLTNISEIFRKN
jgi:hypothetical protein